MIKNKFSSEYKEEANGKYSYVGSYYTLPINEEEKKKTAIMNFVFFVLFGVLEVAIGMINPDSSRTAWVIFPYIFLFLPIAYFFIGAYTYVGLPVKMEHAAYRGSIVRMRRSAMGIIILAIVNIIADVVFMIIYRNSLNWAREIIYCVGLVIILVLAVIFGKRMFDKYYVVTID